MLLVIYKITLKELIEVETGGGVADKKQKLVSARTVGGHEAIILQLTQ